MTILELFILAVGVSLDAFAISECKGLAIRTPYARHYIAVGLWLGIFQVLLPLAGYYIGRQFVNYAAAFGHTVAFILLCAIGFNMIRESRVTCKTNGASLAFRHMLPLALGISIDALAAGVAFALLNVKIVPAVSLIGVVTFAFSVLGVRVGCVSGTKYTTAAQIVGGLILILLALKILLTHLGVIG